MDQSSFKLISLLQVVVYFAICLAAPPSLPAELTPEFFPEANSPLQKPTHSVEYVDFINKLYGHDSSKKPLSLGPSNEEQLREISEEEVDDHVRGKRTIAFRPLFEYREEVKEEQEAEREEQRRGERELKQEEEEEHAREKRTITFRPLFEYRQEQMEEKKREEEEQDHERQKRAIIFRPLFVYRQQQVRRQKLKEKRKQQQQARPQSAQSSSSSKPSVIVPANTSHFIVYNNKIYQQYNPYYAPYQYGQKYPYQKW